MFKKKKRLLILIAAVVVVLGIAYVSGWGEKLISSLVPGMAGTTAEPDDGLTLIPGDNTEKTEKETAPETEKATETAKESATETEKATEPASESEKATEKATETEKPTESPSTTAEVKNYYFRNKKLKNEHYEKHGIEMGFLSANAYEAAASAVVNNPAALHKTEKEDGDDVYFVEETGEFVVVSVDGYIRTYFIPSSGKKYFDRQ